MVRLGPKMVTEVHSNLIRRLLTDVTRPCINPNTGDWEADEFGPLHETKTRTTPIHGWMRGPLRSIVVQPLPVYRSDSEAGSTGSREKASTDVATEGLAGTSSNPQVLVAFRVQEGVEDLKHQDWVDWILRAPSEAKSLIKVEGLYGSFSSLLIVRMPVKVWDMLPESRASSFVAFVTTENLAPGFEREVNTLETYVRSQLENPLPHRDVASKSPETSNLHRSEDTGSS
ncbi:hypothetical protein B0T19DRAFT_96344 [Cercophora scortea]|uniref:Uncharacterized protein n=1 Tax=Cercophora scortea TaxID=314031 RepID=A0AAE0IVR2_9PEZI|nr:hypothetical protein B0T19DRAFT_96344 [Cercophora scortea]